MGRVGSFGPGPGPGPGTPGLEREGSVKKEFRVRTPEGLGLGVR